MTERTRAWRRRQARLMIVKIRRTQQWVKARVEEGQEKAREKARRTPARLLRLDSRLASDTTEA